MKWQSGGRAEGSGGGTEGNHGGAIIRGTPLGRDGDALKNEHTESVWRTSGTVTKQGVSQKYRSLPGPRTAADDMSCATESPRSAVSLGSPCAGGGGGLSRAPPGMGAGGSAWLSLWSHG